MVTFSLINGRINGCFFFLFFRPPPLPTLSCSCTFYLYLNELGTAFSFVSFVMSSIPEILDLDSTVFSHHSGKNGDFVLSFITYHCWSSNHNFNFSKDSIVQKCSSIYFLDLWEAFQIWKNSNKLENKLSSTPRFSKVGLLFL